MINMYIIFRTLLNVAHFLYNLYCFIQQQCIRLISVIQQYKYCFNKIQYPQSYHFMEASKIPRHLAILLGHEDISAINLVKLISWCVVAEIPYISFYDHRGVLQKNQHFIKQKLYELEPFITQNIEWSKYSNNENNENVKPIIKRNITEFNTICTNIVTDKNHKISKLKIHILSYADGKDKIVTETKSLANIIDLNNLQVKDITSELLDEKLSFHMKVPDPDLAIVFGKTMCTYGFLPWQTRITEFFMMPTHHISSSKFVETLIKFSNCQQRYGK